MQGTVYCKERVKAIFCRAKRQFFSYSDITTHFYKIPTCRIQPTCMISRVTNHTDRLARETQTSDKRRRRQFKPLDYTAYIVHSVCTILVWYRADLPLGGVVIVSNDLYIEPFRVGFHLLSKTKL